MHIPAAVKSSPTSPIGSFERELQPWFDTGDPNLKSRPCICREVGQPGDLREHRAAPQQNHPVIIASSRALCLCVFLFLTNLSHAQPIPPEKLATTIEALSRLSPAQVEANPKLKEVLARVLE